MAAYGDRQYNSDPPSRRAMNGRGATVSAIGAEEAALGRALQREQLLAERRRVLVLISLLAFLLLLVGALAVLPAFVREEVRERVLSASRPVAAVLVFYLIYESSVALWLTKLIKAERATTPGFRYANAFIEASLPTVALATLAAVVGALPALNGAAPFAYFLFIALSTLNLDARLSLFTGALAGVEFVALSLFLLAVDPRTDTLDATLLMLRSPHQYLIKGMILLAAGGVAAFIATRIRRQLFVGLQTLRERDRAVGIFGQHVSPQVADLLLKQPVELGGQERSVCVMFLDIRGFSQIASERTPAEVMDYLNTLFGFMIPVVNEHQGIINKFLGDGFMAVFGAPTDDADQCRHAVEASHAILQQVDQLNRDGSIPPTRLGIGLHIGPALTGNVGGGERKEYTIIGDSVNLASRIEQATKQFNARLLVSEAVLQALGPPLPPAEDLGFVELRGQPQPVRLFKLA